MITNEYPSVIVDGTKSTARLIEGTNGAYHGNYETAEFPKFDVQKIKKRTETIVLFQFDGEISTSDIKKEMEKENCDPATVETLVSLFAIDNGLAKVSVVALDSVDLDMDLQTYVLKAQVDEDGKCEFSPKPIGKGWGNWPKDWMSGKYPYFAAVRKN